jgi:hypothetical protein
MTKKPSPKTILAITEVRSGRRGVYVQHYEHDGWCKIFVSGKASDCNCNPTVSSYRYEGTAGERSS